MQARTRARAHTHTYEHTHTAESLTQRSQHATTIDVNSIRSQSLEHRLLDRPPSSVDIGEREVGTARPVEGQFPQ